MQGPEHGVWDGANVLNTHSTHWMDERLKFVPAVMLWSKKPPMEALVSAVGLMCQMIYVFGQ